MQPPKDIFCIYGVAFRPHTLVIFTESLFSMLIAVPGVSSSILVQFQTFVEVDHEINLFCKSPPSADTRRDVVSYKRTYVHEGLVNHLVKLAQKKIRFDKLTISHDHSC